LLPGGNKVRKARTVQRLAVVTVLVSGALSSIPVAIAQSSEIQGIEVTAALPGTVHQAETFTVTFELTNTGTTSFDDVVVTAQDACAPSSIGSLVEFTEVQGNGDAFLDSTEVWSYLAPRCVDTGAPSASIALSVSDGVDTLSGVYVFGYTPVIPVGVEPIGQVSVDECLVSSFDVPFRMVTGTSSQVPTAFLGYAIPLQNGGLQIVDQTEFAEIQHISADSDALFDPGEEFLARFFFGSLTQCPDLPEPPLVLLLSMAATSTDSDATWCFGTEGCPTPALEVGTIVELVAEPEEPPAAIDPSLPLTGAESAGLAILGVALLATGGLFLVATRRTSP
jgi:LPXTG-motif cell wall-anchored protein